MAKIPKLSTAEAREALADMAARLRVEPFEILLRLAAGDHAGLNEPATRTRFTSQGVPYQEETISIELRMAAAKECMKYLYKTANAVKEIEDQEKLKGLAAIAATPVTKQTLLEAINMDPIKPSQIKEALAESKNES